MGCRQWVSLTLVMILVASPVTGKGVLYPTDSESRTVYYLDGIWNFRPANESDPDVGHREGWYKQELRKVSNLLLFIFLFSLSFFFYHVRVYSAMLCRGRLSHPKPETTPCFRPDRRSRCPFLPAITTSLKTRPSGTMLVSSGTTGPFTSHRHGTQMSREPGYDLVAFIMLLKWYVYIC
jgi:hypothetical protein